MAHCPPASPPVHLDIWAPRPGPILAPHGLKSSGKASLGQGCRHSLLY